jgi:hypothetical protein
LKLEKYADNFNDMERSDLLLSEITLHQQLGNEINLIKLSCYKSNHAPHKYILHSSENPNNYFCANDSLIQVVFDIH